VEIELPFDDPIVVISFRMNIEDLLDTTIMQVINMSTAQEQSALLWEKFAVAEEEAESVLQDEDMPELPGDILNDGIVPPPEEALPVSNGVPAPQIDAGNGVRPGAESQPAGRALPLHIDPEKLNLLLDIPLKVSVVLGRTKKQIKDVLQMTPGAIVELETIVGEPVEILVNGKLVARGEVVVVNENFGVKITSIISTKDRIHTLGANNLN
ncbi:MAG: flagellar motor switch protein FliN, partial [Firmicutes bacterium]|nr:flagellar motor switch protein FliN [Bacillota bacterium]